MREIVSIRLYTVRLVLGPMLVRLSRGPTLHRQRPTPGPGADRGRVAGAALLSRLIVSPQRTPRSPRFVGWARRCPHRRQRRVVICSWCWHGAMDDMYVVINVFIVYLQEEYCSPTLAAAAANWVNATNSTWIFVFLQFNSQTETGPAFSSPAFSGPAFSATAVSGLAF